MVCFLIRSSHGAARSRAGRRPFARASGAGKQPLIARRMFNGNALGQPRNRANLSD